MQNPVVPGRTPAGIITNWTFVPTEPSLEVKFKAAIANLYRKARPSHEIIKPLRSTSEWIAYFVYLPDGRIGDHHRFTLARLRDAGLPLFIVCAAPNPGAVPTELQTYADALYWKGLSGYDFSAYTLIIEAIAQHSCGANVIVLNDSMFGPFSDLRPLMRAAPWDMTGFTASALNGNHIQSYAFSLKSVTSERVSHLRPVFPAEYAFDNVNAVIRRQEIRMARVAQGNMSVGSYFYTDLSVADDPCLRFPFELLSHGFPFMKRSLLGKMQKFQESQLVLDRLRTLGHPLTA